MGCEVLQFDSIPIISIGKKIREYLESLKVTAAHHSLCSLSLPQINHCYKGFIVFNGPLIDNVWHSPRDYFGPENYMAYLNPRIASITNKVIKNLDRDSFLPLAML